MANYSPNRKSEFRRTFPAIKDSKGTITWEPDPDSVPEVWGPGTLPGEMDVAVRGASDVVHVLPNGETDETVNPAIFMQTLYEEWLMHPSTRWNLTTDVDTGRKDDEGNPVYEERSLEKNRSTINNVVDPFHRAWLKNELAKEFYPEMFGEADPNSSESGKTGTNGTKAGSKSGSKTKSPSQAQPSLSQAS